MGYLVGVDIGLRFVRGEVTCGDGLSAALLTVEHGYDPPPGAPAAVIDPGRAFDAVVQCLDRAAEWLQARSERAEVVGFSCVPGTIMGITRFDRPVTPAFTAEDAGADSALDPLRRRLNPRRVHSRTGSGLTSGCVPARLAWVRDVDPDGFARAARWMSLGEFVLLRILGDTCVSPSLASSSGMLNLTEGLWDVQVLRVLGIDASRLGSIWRHRGGVADWRLDARPRSPAQARIRAEFGLRWPALLSAGWAPPISSDLAIALGTGCPSAKSVSVDLGPAAAVRVVRPVRGARLLPQVQRQRVSGSRTLYTYRVGGAKRTLDEAIACLPSDRYPDWERDLAARAPCSHELRGLGVGTAELASAVDPSADPLDVVQARLEALAGTCAGAVDRLSEIAEPGAEIVVSGTALSRLPLLGTMLADAIGRPVTLASEPEPACRGAALHAAWAARLRRWGELPSVQDGPILRHDPSRHEAFRRALAFEPES